MNCQEKSMLGNATKSGGKINLMKNKMKIRIIIEDDDGIELENAECLSFESAEETLGKMQRRVEKLIDEVIDDEIKRTEEEEAGIETEL